MQFPFIIVIAFLFFWIWINIKMKEDKENKWYNSKVKQVLDDDSIEEELKYELLKKYTPQKKYNPLGDFADKHKFERDTVYIIATFLLLGLIVILFGS